MLDRPNQNLYFGGFLKAVKLHIEKLAVTRALPRPLSENINVYVDTHHDEMVEVMTLELLMAVQKLERKSTHTLPINRWELLKDYFLPGWAKKIFPVRTRRYELEAKAYYPDVVVNRNQDVQFYVTKTEKIEEGD